MQKLFQHPTTFRAYFPSKQRIPRHGKVQPSPEDPEGRTPCPGRGGQDPTAAAAAARLHQIIVLKSTVIR